MNKRWLRYLIPSIIALALLSMWLYLWLVPVVTTQGGMVYYLKPGTSKKTLFADLHHKAILMHPNWLALFVYFQKSAQLKTGEYLFPKDATAFSIWRQVTTGTGLYLHHFTIIPGWSFNQLREELRREPALKHALTGLNNNAIIIAVGGQTNLQPEGLFYPETYSYTRGVTDLSILKQAYELMQRSLNIAWQNREPGLPYQNAYQALIAASLIEKEAHFNHERPLIAGVLINRLKNNMLLQFDPSVIYGLREHYDGKIHKRNLTEDNEYNTYLHKGLPPTPIAIPSQLSINAALHPEKHEFFYFVAKGDGTHQFSKNLLDHNKAVAAYAHYTVGFFNEPKVKSYIYQSLNYQPHH